VSAYQQYINESRASQQRQDLMREASTERALRAMRSEQQIGREKELIQPVDVVPHTSRVRRAWRSLTTTLASFL
jgi:hypothetical protein